MAQLIGVQGILAPQTLIPARGPAAPQTAESTTATPANNTEAQQPAQAVSTLEPGGATSNDTGSSPFDNELTPEEEKEVQELKQRDVEVRAHEQAHKSAGGPVAGPISYEYVTGPDGRQYAVGGEVQIDASPVTGNPAATIRKMDLVIRAALAPAEPSPQDFAVARQAQQTRLQAQSELREQEEAEREESRGNNPSPLEESGESENLQPNAEILQAIQGLSEAARLSEQASGQLFSGTS